MAVGIRTRTSCVVLINKGAGKVESAGEETSEKILELLSAGGLTSTIEVLDPEKIEDYAAKMAHSDHDAVIAAGGDGTVHSVASALAGTEKPLGIIPLGTLNHFAKDLHVPTNLEDAIGLIVKGPERKIDVAELNGNVFLNNSSIGLYPRMLRERNLQMIRLGKNKWAALVNAAFAAIKQLPIITVRIVTEGTEMVRSTPFIFVGNNHYEFEPLRIAKRKSVEQEVLSIYVAKRVEPLSLVWLFVRASIGAVHREEDFDFFLAQSVRVESKKLRLDVGIDGELVNLEAPLNYRIRPKHLCVIVPE